MRLPFPKRQRIQPNSQTARPRSSHAQAKVCTQRLPSLPPLILALCLCLTLPTLLAPDSAAAADTQDQEFYKQEVLPLLKRHCFECHSHATGKAKGGLVLDSRAALLTGGDLGPAFLPQDPENSLLLRAIRYQSSDLQMPPKGKLDDKQILILSDWIKRGAPAPEEKSFAAPASFESIKSSAQAHWAFQPLRKPAPPPLPASLPPSFEPASASDIDRFLLAKWDAAGIEPAGPADRRTLARRLSLLLAGLPPQPDDIENVASDPAPDALARWVDRLLQGPDFGERWGRFWLDVARYADSNGGGSESNNTHDDAWRYRDYVITSFNENKPFHHFIQEQIAGDLLPATSEEQRRSQLIATGFLLLGPKAFGTGDWEQFRLDTIDEQLDTIGKSLLGLAIGCARCHDHKSDPIPTADYYRLAGILASTFSVERAPGWRQGRTWSRIELPLDAELSAALKDLHKRRLEEAKDAKPRADAEVEEAKRKLKEAQENPANSIPAAEQALRLAERKRENAGSIAKVLPIVNPVPTAMAVRDAEKPVHEAIRIRGVPKSKGDQIPRGVLTLFGNPPPDFAVPDHASGRLQLAHWLVDTRHGAGPLVARVMVNRVWGRMTGRPLAESADNLGLTAQPPTHPELLEFLAASFVESGWSVKKLIRDIALSRACSLAAADNPAAKKHDPGNQWLWRHQVRRLDAETLRDSLLSISGQLDPKRGGPTLQHQGLVSFRSDYITLETPSPYSRRTVYLPMLRDAIGLNQYADEAMGMLETFDFADLNLVSGQRNSTTIPTQALFLMNSSFLREQALALAQRLIRLDRNAADRIQRLYQLAYGRKPTDREIVQTLDYVSRFGESDENSHPTRQQRLEAWASLCQAIFSSNEFLFIN